jgi:CheY-like chemotaxis protein
LGAVSHAAATNPDAILLDIVMPGQDSWEVLRQLKHTPQTQAIPVIMCTITDERERARQMGAADYLIKPILETDLTRALERVLSRKSNGTNGAH